MIWEHDYGRSLHSIIHTKMSLFFQGAKPSLIALLAPNTTKKVKVKDVVVRCSSKCCVWEGALPLLLFYSLRWFGGIFGDPMSIAFWSIDGTDKRKMGLSGSHRGAAAPWVAPPHTTFAWAVAPWLVWCSNCLGKWAFSFFLCANLHCALSICAFCFIFHYIGV